MGAFQRISHQVDPSNPMEAANYYADGIPLNEAAWHFASRRHRKRFAEAEAARDRQRTAATEQMRLSPCEAGFTIEALSHGLSCFNGWMTAGQPVQDAISAMREHLCQQIQAGKLVAIGYDNTSRHAGDLPRKLPVDLCSITTLDWRTSTANGVGLEFCSIRIARVKSRPQRPTNKPRIGRHSLGQPIMDAFHVLLAKGRIKRTDFKGAVEEIGKYLVQKKLEKNPPCAKTVKRHIGSEFN